MSKLYLIAQIYCHFIFTPAHRNSGPGSTSSIKPQKHFEGVLNRDGGGGGWGGGIGLRMQSRKAKVQWLEVMHPGSKRVWRGLTKKAF